MGKKNRDIWILMIQNGVSQKDIAEQMDVRREYLCRVMSKSTMTDNMRARILSAIGQITQQREEQQES